jgi:phage terminase large subunit
METYRRCAEAAYRQQKDEEAYELDSEDEFRVLDETIRGEMPEGLWKQLTLTFNPWVNSHWTKTRFFDNTDPDAFTLTTTYRCNEWLDDADRKLIEDTATTNPDRYRVIGLGEYGIPGGAFFNEFRSDVHVIDPFPIPDHWTRYITIDYGLDMLAALWIAVDEAGCAYVYKELYESNLIISDAALRILEVNDGEAIRLHYAPPDLWNRRQESGKSVADWFREYGIILFKSNNDRVDGWLSVKEWLKPYETRDIETGDAYKTAKMRLFKNCHNLIRCLPQLKSDEKNPNIVDNEVGTKGHELTHAPDALRYFCVMRHRPSDPVQAQRQKSLWDRCAERHEGNGEPTESYIYMQVGGYR